ncbi:MAG: Asp23/Gls24 family envelope stress response protein [Chloroflexi bacterium]|nr:Asp23/Gls24 family envelope stress response protein [Chloroflexota bacterium]
MSENLGKVTVAPEVIMDIVRQTALATPGVARLDTFQPRRVKRWFSENSGAGIALAFEDELITIDLYVIAEPDAQMLTLGQTLQREISRAIQDVLRMPVQEINVHIEDVADRFANAA